MILFGLFWVGFGIINAVISLVNYRATGWNNTRLKFVTYNWAFVLIGIIFIIIGIAMNYFHP